MARVNFTNVFVVVFIACTILQFVIEHILEAVDCHARKINGGKIPAILQSIEASKMFDSTKLKKISDYENSKYYLWFVESFVDLGVTLFLMLSGVLPAFFNFVAGMLGYPSSYWTMYGIMFLTMLAISLFQDVFSLPFDIYSQFCLEKKYGFSKMTARLYIIDGIKSIIISVVMTGVLLLAIVGVIYAFKSTWWIFVSAVLIVFTLVLQVLYPIVLAPLFNKFTPLQEGELKCKITDLMQKAGFTCSGIFTVDESKRSTHSNAYFTGLGKSKRVVLYDTLIKQLSTDELVAVLGHEFGHYKLHHITRRLVVSIPLIFVSTFVLFKLAQSISLYTGFGFAFAAEQIQNVQFMGFILLNLVLSDASKLLRPLVNYFSRKDEYAADKFSSKLLGTGQPLCSALVKLNSENLHELLPPPLYVFWNYSHPSLVQRVSALQNTNMS